MEWWDLWSLASLVRLARAVQRRSESAKSIGNRIDCATHVDQHAGAALGQDRPKYFYRDKNRVTGAAGCAGALAQYFDRARRKLYRFLAQREPIAEASLSSRRAVMDDWDHYSDCRGDGRIAFLDGRLEQHHVHRG